MRFNVFNKVKSQQNPWDKDKQYLSHGDKVGAATKSVETKSYTGTNMIGIATMHKSNSVPVFSGDEAKEITKMRRG